MLEREGYPPGVPCWIDTAQPDPAAAAAFYGGLFGWELDDRMPAEAPDRYLVATLDGRDVAAIGSQPNPATPVWNTYIAVESADGAAAKAKVAGGSVLADAFDVGDTGRMAVLADPAGATFCVWQAGSHHGAQVVNAPGTWNWSNLNTSDPEGAMAFYGAVFGWHADVADFGTMWRLPGYGDVLAARDPDLRERHAEAGIPAGFSDAIGWMAPTTDPPHWSVTFAVGDADATASRAAQLGGTVVVPPFDAGPARVAVLSDPRGAVFTVSRYDPS